jgi:hypothetical protein
MKQFLKHIGWLAALALLLLSACAKYDYAADQQRIREDGEVGAEGIAIGTVRSRDGIRFIRLDGVSCSEVMNPKEIQDIPDGTRVFLQYRYVVEPSVADFCADAILVEWASPLEVGEVRYELSAQACDPVYIIQDWMTSLEDGFLTLHYNIQASGKVKHDFSLYPGVEPNTYRLVHDAHGDFKGEMTDGLVCFDVSGLLPETEDDPVELSLEYIDLQNTNRRLTVEYQSPK